MKGFIFILIVGFVTSQVLGGTTYRTSRERPRRNLKTKLIEFLDNDMRILLQTGNSTLNLPILDIYEKDEQTIEIDTPEIMAVATLYNFFVEKLSEYVVIDADINIFKLQVMVSLSFPEVFSRGFYVVNGEAVGAIPFYGEGEFNMIARDFSVDAVIGIGLHGDLVKSLKLNIALDNLKFDATGLYNDDNISNVLSIVISDLVPNFIRDFHDHITGFVEPIVIKIVNEHLEGLSWKDLIAMINY